MGSPESRNASAIQTNEGRYTLHVTTREVVVEVVARDHHGHPVNDLTQQDFEIFENAQKAPASQRRISGFRVIDPEVQEASEQAKAPGAVLPLGGRCEIRSTLHYELAFHPADWSSGTHNIRIVARRKHVTLSYRSQVYFGVTAGADRLSPGDLKAVNAEISDAACYHLGVPSSILLNAAREESGDPKTEQFLITVPPESLDFAGIDASSRQLHLEYGVCTFTRTGNIIGLWKSSLHRTVSASDLSAILDAGWSERLRMPRRGVPALARIVVLEPRSGNVGTIDLALANPARVTRTSARQQLAIPMEKETERTGGNGSLGSLLPAPGAFCGDVYELPRTTTLLPGDFRALNAVGAVFTDFFNVPERILPHGIPGSTARTEWFGVDYYGEFWIQQPGQYEFEFSADDGADLYIDDHLLLANDGIHPPRTVSGTVKLLAGKHAIHLPYFQGPTYVSLVLKVKPPNGILDVFDIRDYARPRPIDGAVHTTATK